MRLSGISVVPQLVMRLHSTRLDIFIILVRGSLRTIKKRVIGLGSLPLKDLPLLKRI
ncbi:hypothetical protein ALP79_200027 [Pseudomonas savastanoi pv. fraxini]|nr:hypothetical protein ALP79_200027 [Pseudomonas savastanoi pv. fraxini]RMR67110.1 hypothetical protein ALP80_200102 [Pseudomonas savastanoi pv. fraxini]